MDELVVFWKEVDECIQKKMGMFTDIEIKRNKHECIWDRSESVIYSAGKLKLQILANTQGDELCIQVIISYDKGMATRDFVGKFSAEFQSSDLKSAEDEESFLDFLGGYAKTTTLIIAVKHFCCKEGYRMEYYVSRGEAYVFYIYKHKKGYDAKLRMFIGVPTNTDLAVILFHERFYISMTARPKMMDSPLLLQNSADLHKFMEDALKNGSATTSISQLLHEKVYIWDQLSNQLDCLPPLELPSPS